MCMDHFSILQDLAISYDVYYFDIQNPEEILQGEKPVVTQVGPYAFKEYFNKFDISWTDDGDTVTYNTQRYYVFDEERTTSGLTLSDKITLPYPSVIGFEYLISEIPSFATDAVNVIIHVSQMTRLVPRLLLDAVLFSSFLLTLSMSSKRFKVRTWILRRTSPVTTKKRN